MSTKAKAKKPKAGTTTKKTTKKKTASVTKKKSVDSKRNSPRKKRSTDEERAKRSSNSDANKKRRSDRNRNSSFNYEESSPESYAPSEGKIAYEAVKRTRRRKEAAGKRGVHRTTEASNGNSDDNDNDNDDSTEANWEIYDQGTTENDACWNEHYRRLQEFHSSHGHSGVPIHWSAEPDFADWVSRQRQLFREIQSGYRIASTREEGRWRRLQVLHFPLNYEKWLWKEKYNELYEALNGGKYTEDTTLPSHLAEWVDRQKSSMEKNCVHGKIYFEQKSNLATLGIIPRDDSSDAVSDG